MQLSRFILDSCAMRIIHVQQIVLHVHICMYMCRSFKFQQLSYCDNFSGKSDDSEVIIVIFYSYTVHVYFN